MARMRYAEAVRAHRQRATGNGQRLLAVAGLTLGAWVSVGAQTTSGRCTRFEFRNTPNTRLSYQRLPSGNQNIFIGAGVNAYCALQNLTILADSAEHYGDVGVWYLIGRVRYAEPRVDVTSRRATYWTREDRLLAEGDVVATLPSGTVMRGPRVEYWRETPNVRPRARIEATGRPTVRLVQRDTTLPANAPPRVDTANVTANVIVMDGDSLVYTSGKVEISRPDLIARGDSAFMDSGKEFARLMREPSVEATGARPMTLTGTVIDVWSKQRSIERVLAAGAGKATSRDLLLTADSIDLRMTAKQLSRAFAWGPRRAVAESPGHRLIADSLDILMPGQRLTEVRAVRRAYAESAPDSTKLPPGTARDWLRGDTVFAYFDTTARAAGDTSGGPRLRSLRARGNARAFYHLPPDDPRARQAALNYVVGRMITVSLQNQGVQTVSVAGKASGAYLQPSAGRRPAADTSAAPKPPAGRP